MVTAASLKAYAEATQARRRIELAITSWDGSHSKALIGRHGFTIDETGSLRGNGAPPGPPVFIRVSLDNG